MNVLIGFAVLFLIGTVLVGYKVKSNLLVIGFGAFFVVLSWASVTYLAGNQLVKEVCGEMNPCVFNYEQIYSGNHPNPKVNSLSNIQGLNESYGLVLWSLLFLIVASSVRAIRKT